MKKICLKEEMSWEEKRMAVEMALLLGFGSVSAEFPVTDCQEGVEIPKSYSELSRLMERLNDPAEVPAEYVSAMDHARPVPDFDWRKKKGLESLFGLGEFLKDENLDLLPDKLNFYLVLPEECSRSLLAAACDFAFRFGMETTAYEAGLVVKEDLGGNALIFKEAARCAVYMEEEPDGRKVYVTGRGNELEQFAAYFCEHFPGLGGMNQWKDRLQELTDSFVMKNLDGQMAYIAAADKADVSHVRACVSPEIEQRRAEAEKAFPDTEFVNYKGMKKVYEKQYDIPWEADRLLQILEEKVYRKIVPGDRICVLAALSEEKDVRDELTGQIAERLTGLGAKAEEIKVLCAYKQGYSWIEESVLPQILGSSRRPDKIQIAFRPFLPKGKTEWNDENGATPSYNNVGQGNPDHWYDLPIRYLQELYPAEDMIAAALSMERDQVEFVTYEGNEDITYEFRAFYEGGKDISTYKYRAWRSERPYLDAYPGLGKVHPSTGYIKVLINGAEVLDERIETDVERVWDIYQREVLKDCREFIEQKLRGKISVENQPFFSQLRLELELSEPDYRLQSREDLFSSLDALHEDLYFAGADYFKNYGIEKVGKMLEEPGLILPVIKKGKGKPSFRVILYDQAASEPCIFLDGAKLAGVPEREEAAVYMTAVEYQEGEMTVTIETEGVPEEAVSAYADLMNQGMTSDCCDYGRAEWLRLKAGEKYYKAHLPKLKEEEKALDIREIDLLEDTLIGYDQYMDIIEKLKRTKGILVYRTAVSYTGREIYAVEILPEEKGYVSRTKRITKYPSEIINCRHHANEVSSTNAAFMLLKQLLTDEKYRALTEKLNLVIVPMENVDGAAIHYELQKENPNWKLHVARFNAVGKEFYHEHFKPDTKHTEAMGLTRLYERFLPDVIVDNHGVPSHEWEQQFSGYTSPSFKGFWLPRSLLYGYFWTVSDEEYKSNYPVNKKMEDVIADAIGEEADMAQLNDEWAARFEKYAHAWMPKLFPADYYKGMINYWIPFAADPVHRYPSIRFPWITTVAYTSEVADETAQGSYLNLCAKAHVKHDLAVIEMLAGARCIYKEHMNVTEEGLSVSQIRQRPVIV